MQQIYRRTPIPKCDFNKVAIVKGVLKICSKFTGEHSCRSLISIKFRTPFTKNTSGWLLLHLAASQCFHNLKIQSKFRFSHKLQLLEKQLKESILMVSFKALSIVYCLFVSKKRQYLRQCVTKSFTIDAYITR